MTHRLMRYRTMHYELIPQLSGPVTVSGPDHLQGLHGCWTGQGSPGAHLPPAAYERASRTQQGRSVRQKKDLLPFIRFY